MSTSPTEDEFQKFSEDCKKFCKDLITFLKSPYIKGKYDLGVHMATFSAHLDYLKQKCDEIDKQEFEKKKNENIH